MSEEKAIYNAGEQPPKLQKVISRAINLPDRRRISVLVDAPIGSDNDLAMGAFDILLDVLQKYEAGQIKGCLSCDGLKSVMFRQDDGWHCQHCGAFEPLDQSEE